MEHNEGTFQEGPRLLRGVAEARGELAYAEHELRHGDLAETRVRMRRLDRALASLERSILDGAGRTIAIALGVILLVAAGVKAAEVIIRELRPPAPAPLPAIAPSATPRIGASTMFHPATRGVGRQSVARSEGRDKGGERTGSSRRPDEREASVLSGGPAANRGESPTGPPAQSGVGGVVGSSGVGGVVESVGAAVGGAVVGAVDGATETLSDPVGQVVDTAGELVQGAQDAIPNLPDLPEHGVGDELPDVGGTVTGALSP